MAIAASLLRGEMRRHLLMNVSLVTGCIVAGTVVTNERGLFVPLTTMSETARAFSAMFTQSHLLPDNTDMTEVRMVSPLSPFEVTADSRDLRRRLMDSLTWLPEQAADNNKEISQLSEQTLTPTELASNQLPPSALASSAPPPAATASAPPPPPSAPPPTVLTPKADTPAVTQPPVINQPSAPTPPAQESTQPTPPDDNSVPEPSTWAMLIAGFGFVGYFLRNARRRSGQAGDIAA